MLRISPKVIFSGRPSVCFGVWRFARGMPTIEARRSRESNYRFLVAWNKRELLCVVGVEKRAPFPFNRLFVAIGHFEQSRPGRCIGILSHLLAGCGHLTQFSYLTTAAAIFHCTFDCTLYAQNEYNYLILLDFWRKGCPVNLIDPTGPFRHFCPLSTVFATIGSASFEP
ncbi:hypothetical protein [Bradyrhizobium tunisiense]|uniref:hypothetical protein n=1 Tax=Bradyrhizobium tunisiense TaxID=3278709 RepID=UPI0035DC2993